MEVPMYRIRRAASCRYTANRIKRWAQPFTRRQILQAARALWPMLATLAFASVAHAQGTMDFSGATTLMSTFNVGASAIQSQIIFTNPGQIIAKQSVRAFDRQREHIRNLKQHAQRGMVAGTTKV
ncbi:hypothetical protein RBB78_24435 [Tunturiibacter empetritectus]|uniref:hypothetical protein n=1 Tax=Tunturiibacter empetritectus TaxID=3069691 RepID=UPI003D9B10E4